MFQDPLFLIAAIAVLAVAAILMFGIGGFARGADAKQANKVMRWRIYAQALAVVLILIFVLVRRMG